MSGFLLNSYIISSPPVNLSLPVISGTTTSGQTLSTTDGTWSGTPTSYAYQWNRSGSPISGATFSSYVLVSGDVGTTITVTVTATNDIGSTAATSAATATIAQIPAPVNISAPTITGTAQVGQTLTAGVGSWTNSPTSYAYQWRRNGGNISGETLSTYTTTINDDNTTLTVSVTATNAGGSTAAVSAGLAITQPAPFALGNPSISGTTTVGQTLTATTGTWANSPTSYTYQWFNGSGVALTTATTSSTYVLIASDQGSQVRVQVTASNSGGSGQAVSSLTATVAQAVPVNSVAPTISGTAQVGSTLTATTGTWANSPTSYAYQWFRSNGVSISGATSSTYVLTASEQGLQVRVRVTASNSSGAGTAAFSSFSATIAQLPAPVNTSAPSISGTAQVGNTLTALNGSWTNSPTSYAYQWRRNGVNISGATSVFYVPTASDDNTTLTVSVIATNAGGSSAAAVSAGVAITQPVPVNSVAPTISGTAQVGQTLTATTGTWSNTPTSYVYQWLRSGVAISGATSSTYVLTTSEQGFQVRVRVTASNSGGAGTPALSSLTATVAAQAKTSNVQYLVVAGGGGGGSSNDRTGGGGGAGGYRTATNFAVSTGSPITVTVGGGGASITSGTASVFGSIISTGGGRGGYISNLPVTGGSGGGGHHAQTAGAVGTTGQGTAGGRGFDSGGTGNGDFCGGGGGGASGAGVAGSSTAGGNGGIGTANSISGSSIIYAAGGGGGTQYGYVGNTFVPTRGFGGGNVAGNGAGNGALATVPTATAGSAASANQGGGGGGGASNGAGGAGGSGVVIIRYANTFALATSTTGSPTYLNSGGFHIYRWTGSGSITF